jgi:hypothetical protein
MADRAKPNVEVERRSGSSARIGYRPKVEACKSEEGKISIYQLFSLIHREDFVSVPWDLTQHNCQEFAEAIFVLASGGGRQIVYRQPLEVELEEDADGHRWPSMKGATFSARRSDWVRPPGAARITLSDLFARCFGVSPPGL